MHPQVVILVFVFCFGISGAQIIDIKAFQDPPPATDFAAMARYIVRNSDWVSLATISTQRNINGYPFVSVKSTSDGPANNSTGVPYFYMTNLDLSGKDLAKDNRATIVATLAEGNYCLKKNWDEQNPQCPKVMISGRFKKIPKNSAEDKFAKSALFDRHPEMKNWPAAHMFFTAKIDIENIFVLDKFGGVQNVDVSDYFNANSNIYWSDI